MEQGCKGVGLAIAHPVFGRLEGAGFVIRELSEPKCCDRDSEGGKNILKLGCVVPSFAL